MTNEDLKTLKNLGVIEKDFVTKSGKYKIEMKTFGLGKSILGRIIRIEDDYMVSFNDLSYDTFEDLAMAWDYNCISMKELAERH